MSLVGSCNKGFVSSALERGVFVRGDPDASGCRGVSAALFTARSIEVDACPMGLMVSVVGNAAWGPGMIPNSIPMVTSARFRS